MTSAEQPRRPLSRKVAAIQALGEQHRQEVAEAEAYARDMTRVECKCSTCRAEGGSVFSPGSKGLRAALVPPTLAAEHAGTGKGRAYLVRLAYGGQSHDERVRLGVIRDPRTQAPA